MNMDRHLGTKPVSPEAPCGQDARYSDEFEGLQQEVDKLASPLGRASFAWETVAEKAAAILAHHSKDMLAACYLAVALTHVNGAAGFEAGAWVLRDLILTHWTGMFPPVNRRKGRLAALGWYTEKTEAAITDGVLWGFDNVCRDAALDHLRTMDVFLKAQDGDFNLMPLVRIVENTQTVDSPSPVAVKQERTAGMGPLSHQVESQTTQRPEIPGQPCSEDPAAGLSQLFQKLKASAKIMGDESMENPQSYRWLRFAIWEPLKGLPAAKDRVTRISSPTPQLVSRLETLYQSGDWPELLRASEAALHSSKNLFYLDLNRFSFEALSNMGARYENACRCVFSETRNFVSRFQSIETLYFEDKTPFASEQTREWIHMKCECVTEEAGLISGSEEIQAGRFHDELVAVRDSIKKGIKTPEAVSLYLHRIRASSSGRETLLWRLELLDLLASARLDKLAEAQIAHILETVDRHVLGVWAPEIAVQGLRAVYKVLKAHPETRRRIKPDDVLVRIAGFDPLAAMGL